MTFAKTPIFSCIIAFNLGVARSQATFDLVNRNLTVGLDSPVYDWTGNRLWGPDWRVELYGGPTPEALVPASDLHNPGARITVAFVGPGYFKDLHFPSSAVYSVSSGGWAWLQVKVWDVTVGTTYDEASARALGGYGESTPFYARGGNPYALDPPRPLIGLQSFSVLQPVPEPSTYALLLAGVGSLCWLCRRKA